MGVLNVQVESALLDTIKLNSANETLSLPTDKHNYCNLCFLLSELMGVEREKCKPCYLQKAV